MPVYNKSATDGFNLGIVNLFQFVTRDRCVRDAVEEKTSKAFLFMPQTVLSRHMPSNKNLKKSIGFRSPETEIINFYF